MSKPRASSSVPRTELLRNIAHQAEANCHSDGDLL